MPWRAEPLVAVPCNTPRQPGESSGTCPAMRAVPSVSMPARPAPGPSSRWAGERGGLVMWSSSASRVGAWPWRGRCHDLVGGETEKGWSRSPRGRGAPGHVVQRVLQAHTRDRGEELVSAANRASAAPRSRPRWHWRRRPIAGSAPGRRTRRARRQSPIQLAARKRTARLPARRGARPEPEHLNGQARRSLVQEGERGRAARAPRDRRSGHPGPAQSGLTSTAWPKRRSCHASVNSM